MGNNADIKYNLQGGQGLGARIYVMLGGTYGHWMKCGSGSSGDNAYKAYAGILLSEFNYVRFDYSATTVGGTDRSILGQQPPRCKRYDRLSKHK